MFEKNREASALAAISRAIAEQQKQGLQNNATTTKPTETSGLEHLDAPGPHSASKIQRREEEQVTPAIKTHKNRNNENKAEKFKSQDRGVDEILEPPLQSPSPPPPSQPQLLSTTNAFHDWYLAEIADNFEPEIEALNDADAPVGSKVLIQALESNLALFSPQERKVALSESN